MADLLMDMVGYRALGWGTGKKMLTIINGLSTGNGVRVAIAGDFAIAGDYAVATDLTDLHG